MQDEMLESDLFSTDLHKEFFETGISKIIYMCVIDITLNNSEFKFQKNKTETFLRADAYRIDEEDTRVQQVIGNLRKDVSIINYFQAKHTYVPVKSFVEYIQVVPVKK